MPAQPSLDQPAKPSPNKEYALRQQAVKTAVKATKHNNYFKEDEKYQNENENEKTALIQGQKRAKNQVMPQQTQKKVIEQEQSLEDFNSARSGKEGSINRSD